MAWNIHASLPGKGGKNSLSICVCNSVGPWQLSKEARTGALAVGLLISQTVMLQQKHCLTSLIRLGEGFSSMFVFDHNKTLQGRVLFDIHYIMFKC